MAMPETLTPYSADVDLWFECESGRIPLAQVATTFIIPARPTTLPPCRGTLVISVDGKQFRGEVDLVQGMSPDLPDALILSVDDAAPF